MRRRAEAVPDERRFVEYLRADGRRAGRRARRTGRARRSCPNRLQAILSELVAAQRLLALPGDFFLHVESATEAEQQLLDAVGRHHRQQPASPGMTLDQLRQACRFPRAVLEALLGRLKAAGRLVERNGRLALSEHRATLPDELAKQAAAVEELFRRAGFQPPSREEAAAAIGAPAATVNAIVETLRQHDRLMQVEEMFFHCEAVDRAKQILLAHLRKEGRLESVQFKYLLDTTRKFALPLLDYFDRVGVTRRAGNTRFLKGGKTP